MSEVIMFEYSNVTCTVFKYVHIVLLYCTQMCDVRIIFYNQIQCTVFEYSKCNVFET